jgi:hypothetical protein
MEKSGKSSDQCNLWWHAWALLIVQETLPSSLCMMSTNVKTSCHLRNMVWIILYYCDNTLFRKWNCRNPLLAVERPAGTVTNSGCDDTRPAPDSEHLSTRQQQLSDALMDYKVMNCTSDFSAHLMGLASSRVSIPCTDPKYQNCISTLSSPNVGTVASHCKCSYMYSFYSLVE